MGLGLRAMTVAVIYALASTVRACVCVRERERVPSVIDMEV